MVVVDPLRRQRQRVWAHLLRIARHWERHWNPVVLTLVEIINWLLIMLLLRSPLVMIQNTDDIWIALHSLLRALDV